MLPLFAPLLILSFDAERDVAADRSCLHQLIRSETIPAACNVTFEIDATGVPGMPLRFVRADDPDGHSCHGDLLVSGDEDPHHLFGSNPHNGDPALADHGTFFLARGRDSATCAGRFPFVYEDSESWRLGEREGFDVVFGMRWLLQDGQYRVAMLAPDGIGVGAFTFKSVKQQTWVINLPDDIPVPRPDSVTGGEHR